MSSVTEAGESPSEIFARAQKAFRAGNFQRARKHAERTKQLLCASSPGEVRSHDCRVAPRTSIIIVTQPSNDCLNECLSGLRKYSSSADHEVIIVVNGSENPPNLGKEFSVVHTGFNYGCSGGRNIGARLAQGEFILFLDDDGSVEKGAVEELVSTILKYPWAVTVRGRILAKSPSGGTATHYDLGEGVRYSTPNTEGFSIWRKHQFLEFGGFDPLLAGHEGLALYSMMYPYYGLNGFIYTSKAVFYHDYAASQTEAQEKRERYQSNKHYLDCFYPDASTYHRLLLKARKSALRPPTAGFVEQNSVDKQSNHRVMRMLSSFREKMRQHLPRRK